MELLLFALQSSRTFGEKIAYHLEHPLSPLEERHFEDGEHKIRPLVNVRGRDVFVVQSLFGDDSESVNDKLIKLLFFISDLKDASAASVTAVLPYLCYARKDRKTKSSDPVCMRYMAQLLEAAGVDQVIVMDVHNVAAFQNAFRIPTVHLEGSLLFASWFRHLSHEELVVVSPDAGGMKRAEKLKEILEKMTGKSIGISFLQKTRSEGTVTGGRYLAGDVKGKTAIIIDDIVNSGTTLKLALDTVHAHGARKIYACITHALLSEKSSELFSCPYLEKLLVSDSVLPFRVGTAPIREKIHIMDSSHLFARAIERVHFDDSLIELEQNFSFQESSLPN